MQEGALATIELRLTWWGQVRQSVAEAASSSLLPQVAFAGALAATCLGSFAIRNTLLAACAFWAGLVAVRALWLLHRTRAAVLDRIAGKSTFTFFAEGYLVEGSPSITFHRWSDVMRIERNARELRLMHDRARGHVVPSSAFASERAFETMSARLYELWRRGQSREVRQALALPAVSVLSEIRFEQTRSSARKLLREQISSAHPWLRPLSEAVHGATLVLLAMLLFTALRTSFLFGCLVAVLLVLGLVAAWLCGRALVRTALGGLLRALPGHKRGPVHVALAEEGVVCVTRHSVMFVPWTCVREVRETDSFVVLHTSRGELVPVPKLAFAAPVQATIFAGLATRRSNGDAPSERRFSTHPPPAMA